MLWENAARCQQVAKRLLRALADEFGGCCLETSAAQRASSPILIMQPDCLRRIVPSTIWTAGNRNPSVGLAVEIDAEACLDRGFGIRFVSSASVMAEDLSLGQSRGGRSILLRRGLGPRYSRYSEGVPSYSLKCCAAHRGYRDGRQPRRQNLRVDFLRNSDGLFVRKSPPLLCRFPLRERRPQGEGRFERHATLVVS